MRQESVLNVFRTALIMLVGKAHLTGAAVATAFAQTIPRRQLCCRTPKASRTRTLRFAPGLYYGNETSGLLPAYWWL